MERVDQWVFKELGCTASVNQMFLTGERLLTSHQAARRIHQGAGANRCRLATGIVMTAFQRLLQSQEREATTMVLV
jgi:hypothetical protein